MYNNFSSKKTKKVISALLASALVVTSAPITADAATTSKVLGVKKTFTVAGTKVTGLSKAEKKVVKVTIKNKKVTVKGLKAGKVTFKIGKKAYTVKVGATKVALTPAATSLKVNETTKVAIVASNGKNDKLTVKTSNNSIVKISKSSVTANASGKASITLRGLAAGTSKITVKSENTGKTASVKIKVVADEVVTQAPVVSDSPVVSGDPSTSQAPVVSGDPSASQAPATSNDPNASQAPTVTTGAATAVPTAAPATMELSSFAALNSQEKEVELTDVPASSTLVFKFNQPVKEETVNVNNIRIFEDATNVPVSVTANDIAITADKKTVKVQLPKSTIEKGIAYRVVVKDITNDDNIKMVETVKNFTVSKMAIVDDTTFDYNDYSSANASVTNTSFSNNISTGDVNDTITNIAIVYDAALDLSSLTTANVSLVDVKTGARMPITLSKEIDGNKTRIEIVPTAGFENYRQYIVTVGEGVLTSVGNKAEAYSTTFAIQAAAPMTGGYTVTTLDGKAMGTTSPDLVWPKLTEGMKETATTDQYYAALNIQVKTAVRWDAATVAEYVQLVEKDTDKIVNTTMTYNSGAQILSIIPTADLKEDTTYTIQFKGGLKTSLGICLDATKKDKVINAHNYSFKTLDVSAPTVKEIVSADGLTDLKSDEEHVFTVKLGENLDLSAQATAVVIAKTSVKNDDASTFTGTKAGDIVTGYTITKVVGKDDEYTIKISKDVLAKSQAYKIMIIGKDIADTAIVKNTPKTILTDAGNNRLVKTYTLAFTTEGEDVTGPKIKAEYNGDAIKSENTVATSGAINVLASDKFTLEFNEKIKTGTDLNTSLFKLQKNEGGVWNDVVGGISGVTAVEKVASSGEYYGVTVQLTATTLADAKYRIVVAKGAVKDLVGNENADDYYFNFIGSANDDTAAVVKPGKIATNVFTVAADETAVAVDSLITIGFAESEIVEIPAGSIKVTDANGKVVAGEIEEVTSAVENFANAKRYVFKPSANLAYSTTYTVTVDGIYDFIGNKITKMQYQFKTAGESTKITSTSIKDGDTNVDLQKSITIALNNKMTSCDTTGTKAANTVTVQLYDTATGATADILDDTNNKATLSGDGKTVTITFNGTSNMVANTAYTLDINADNAVDNTKIKFTTGMTATDDVKPVVATVGGGTISNNAVTIAPATNINIVYSEDINIDGATVKLYSLGTEIKEVGLLPNAASESTLTVTTALSSNPATGDKFKLVVTGVKDTNGNAADDMTVYITIS